ncbi:hypothetical protein FGIG_04518 [Fasciola gigantica]|uniref:Uncharacterized protein n=1 Tax=Fasciola gigantica TaxID=46835 RepID=A0A504YEH6_FASGI|nr:hypothetical protein FGIG_04518 [Fasciola gigantica]
METKSDTAIPETVDFSADLTPQTFWLRYLVVVFSFVLTWRVAHALGVINRVHKLLILLCSVLTASGRKRRAERKRLTAELRSMRSDLKSINMVQHFASYSKLERRIKATSRQLDQLAPETYGKSLVRFLVIKMLLFVCEGVLTGWLISRCPPVTLTKLELDDAQLRDSYLLPLLKLLYYLPAKLVVLLWIGISHWFCVSIAKHICLKTAVTPISEPVGSSQLSNDMD